MSASHHRWLLPKGSRQHERCDDVTDHHHQQQQQQQQQHPRTRVPLVSLDCTCPRRRPVSAVRPRSRDGRQMTPHGDRDSSDSDQDEGVTIGQLLRAFRLYESRPSGQKSLSALRNLVHSFSGQRPVDVDQVEQLMSILSHHDPGLREVSILTIGQLCNNTATLRSLLQENIVRVLLELLSSGQQARGVIAVVLQKVLEHSTLCDHWMDEMLTSHLDFLARCMEHAQNLTEKLALARVLRVLAKYAETCQDLLERHLPAIGELVKDGSAMLQGEFCGILAELVTQAKEESIKRQLQGYTTIGLDILKQSPCCSQSEAAELLAALSGKAAGHGAIISQEIVPYLMSGILDSNCRQVRAACLHALSKVLVHMDSANTEKVMLDQLDDFFHSHEEGFETEHQDNGEEGNTARSQDDKTSRLTRTVEELSNSLVNTLCDEARIHLNPKTGLAVDVKLTPTVDTDVTVLSLLQHCVMALGYFSSLKFNGTKVNLDIPEEWTEIDMNGLQQIRHHHEKHNPNLTALIMDSGALCTVDLLQAYTRKLQDIVHSTSRVPPKEAWSKGPNSASTKPNDPSLLDQFDTHEVSLIEALLNTIRIFTSCSCNATSDTNNITTAHLIAERLKKYKTRHRTYTMQALQEGESYESSNQKEPPTTLDSNHCQSAELGSNDEDDDDEIIDLTQFDSPTDERTLDFVAKRYRRLYNSKTAVLRRQIRARLYEAGVLEAVGPWLSCQHPAIMETASEILKHMLQPLDEATVSAGSGVGQKVRFRPISAMTSKEREQAVNMAVSQMSSNMRGFIKDALGTTTEETTTADDDDNILSQELNRNNLESTEKVTLPEGEGQPSTFSHLANVSGSNSECEVVSHDSVFGESNSSAMSKTPNTNTDELGVYNDNDGSDNGYDSDDIAKVNDCGVDDPVRFKMAASTSARPGSTRVRPHSAKVPLESTVTCDASSYKHFARTPSRPGSAIPKVSVTNSRPTSAKVLPVSKQCTARGRPNSAHEENRHPTKGRAPKMHPKHTSQCSNTKLTRRAGMTSKAPQSHNDDTYKPEMWQEELRTTTKYPKVATSGRKMKDQPLPAINNNINNVPKIDLKILEAACRSKPKPPKVTKPKFSRPILDVRHPVTEQCQRHLVTACCGVILHQLFSKDMTTKLVALDLLEEAVKHAQGGVLMEMSQHGVVPKLIDFIRVNDDQQVLELYGLTLIQQLVTRDVRLRQLFHKHGGTQLLVAMLTYTEGPLRQEVCSTLKLVSRGLGSEVSQTGARIVQSAPPGGVQRVQAVPDVWDHILTRWRDEDRVKNLLRQNRTEPRQEL